MYETRYALTKELPGVAFADAVARVRETLPGEGFGVVTELDIQATLRKKLGVERRPYLILGACNPQLALAALELEPAIGTLLPCNVSVFEGEDGVVRVQAVNPAVLFEVSSNPGARPIAEDVAGRLTRVLARL